MNRFTKSTKDLADSVSHMVDEADQFLKIAAESGDVKFDSLRGKLVDQVHHVRENLEDLERDRASGSAGNAQDGPRHSRASIQSDRDRRGLGPARRRSSCHPALNFQH